MVRAHLTGFAPSRRQLVEVRSASTAWFKVTLQKTSPLTAAAKATPPPPPPKVLSAEPRAQRRPRAFLLNTAGHEEKADGADDRTEKAWRIRHLPRSVLKDTTERRRRRPSKDKAPDTGEGQRASRAPSPRPRACCPTSR